MNAAAHGHTECARLLLDAGADKDTLNNERASAGVAYELFREALARSVIALCAGM